MIPHVSCAPCSIIHGHIILRYDIPSLKFNEFQNWMRLSNLVQNFQFRSKKIMAYKDQVPYMFGGHGYTCNTWTRSSFSRNCPLHHTCIFSRLCHLLGIHSLVLFLCIWLILFPTRETIFESEDYVSFVCVYCFLPTQALTVFLT